MRITKYGHSCLFVEEGEARILIDPGSYCFKDTALKPDDLPECNVLLLTHEHPDHTFPEALKIILDRSRTSMLRSMEVRGGAVVLTNAGVQKVLREQGIESELLARGEERTVHGVKIRAVACDHGVIAPHIPLPENFGFLIAGRLLDPGDCVHPSEPVACEILAVPVVAPWMAVKEAVEFVKAVKPKIAIPIHDAMVKWPEIPWYKIFETELKDTGIEFSPLKLGEAREF